MGFPSYSSRVFPALPKPYKLYSVYNRLLVNIRYTRKIELQRSLGEARPQPPRPAPPGSAPHKPRANKRLAWRPGGGQLDKAVIPP